MSDKKGVKDPATFDALHVPDPLPPGPPPAPPVVSPDPVEESPPAKREGKATRPEPVQPEPFDLSDDDEPPVFSPPPGVSRSKRDTDEHWPEGTDRKATVRDKPPLKRDK